MTSAITAERLQAAIEKRFSLRAGFVIKTGAVTDRKNELLQEEVQGLESASGIRWKEYSTGRALSHELMQELGMQVEPVRRDKGRAPLWPDPVCGSITHSRELAVAMLASCAHCRSLGIDLEQIERLDARFASKVLTDSEQQLALLQPLHLAVAFSAKEAGYKAAYPLVRRYIGFKEAEVSIDWQQSRFALRYVGQHPAGSVMDAAQGQFLVHDGYVLTVAIIPLTQDRS